MRYIDDVEVGNEDSLTATYEVSADEIIEMGKRWDPQPFHTDPEAAKDSMFGELVASSSHMFCIWSRLGADERDQDKWIRTETALGFDKLQWHSPVRPGDVLSRRQVLIDARESRSRPGMIVATSAETVINQNDEVVFTLECTFLAPRRDRGIDVSRKITPNTD